ncbi:hypothetical protein [Paraflavitalea sp. CAU 1676]|uniref:hypothetical protein n=1 Tax=Paraflavitalea sp. CAU 1676 TaxID=3032598 RepID=UPI0023DB8F91|nr:hypothetical protein [Paraflavitalea sp. CAU 1676]MDF2193229.1 hypothetical protein [Paraflavitalea sp. CAU 1676]
MKRSFSVLALVACLSMTFTACSKSDKEDGNYGDHPRTTVPDDLVGYWMAGSTSIGSFWGYDGSYQGNGFELANGYMLYKDGKARQYFYYASTSYGCKTQTLGYKEGTVEIDVNKKTFKFYANSGNYRSFSSCNSSSNGQSKTYGSSELYSAQKAEYKDIEFRQENGKIKSWHVYYDDGSSLDFEKSQEPKK